jgi:branched-chain amino acid transport system substrate-binding protein
LPERRKRKSRSAWRAHHGPERRFGAQLKNGVEQAVEDINAAGGINGQKLQLVVGDDVSDPKQGVSIANKFAAEGVKMVVGHFNSGVSIPASEVYQEAGIVQITPASTNEKFTERGMWNTFRTCGRDDQQGGVAGNYLPRTSRTRRSPSFTTRPPMARAWPTTRARP